MYMLVAYDISNARRLRRVAKTMARYGVRVQYSVFECSLTPERLARLVLELRDLINHRYDKVVFYRLCEQCYARICDCKPERVPAVSDIFVW